MEVCNITDISGIRIGHAQNAAGGTGCTVVLCEAGARAGVDVRGGAPATRETDLLNPLNMVESIFAVTLSGGSAYGLDACSGVMEYLEEKGVGFDVGVGVVPIVCGAALFDLVAGDPSCRPDKAMGYEACCRADSGLVPEGNVGAGTGALVGKFRGLERAMKSGLGTFALRQGELIVGALVAVNALGDVADVDTGRLLAGLLTPEGDDLAETEAEMTADAGRETRDVFSGNTTLGCVVTNAKLTKAQCNKIASMAHDGYARTIRPVHTSADGDTIFVMATGQVPCAGDTAGVMAAEAVARAINRAVLTAESAYGYKSVIELNMKGK